MSDKRATDLTELTSTASGDLLYIVDISDTTDSSAGSSRKVQLSNLNPGAVNVKWYGAIGDGVTDDTAAIQAAIDTGSDVIGVRGATYLITGLTQSTDGQTIDFSGSTLKLAASSSTYMLSCSGDHVTVVGGTWDGNKAAGQTTSASYYDHASVRITGDHCTVRKIFSKNSAGLGVKGVGCNYCLVENSYFRQFDIVGIYMESTSAHAYGNRVISNRVDFIDSGSGAISILGKSDETYYNYDYVISNNVVQGYSGMGVAEGGIFTRSPYGNISNNVVRGMPFGITADATDYVTISDNVVYGMNQSPGYGIEFGGSHTVISNNSISDCYYGIIGAVANKNMDYLTVSGNNISNISINHVHIQPPTGKTARYSTITGNTFNWASGATGDVGVSLVKACEYALITGNNFIGPGTANTQARGVKSVDVPGYITITGNRFSGIYRAFDHYSTSVNCPNVVFSNNDCSNDMPTADNLVITSGAGSLGTTCVQKDNISSTGVSDDYIGEVLAAAEIVTTTNVITAAENGRTFYLNAAGGFTSTLPAPAAGLKYTFIVKTAPTTAYIVTTNSGSNVLYGTLLDIVGEQVYFSAQDTINFVASTSVVGDRLEVESDGTNWYCKAFSGADGGITTSVT